MPDINVAVLLFLFEHRTPEGLSLFSKVSEFGGVAIVVAVAVFSAAILSRGKYWAHALGMLVSLGGAVATAFLLKNTLQFTRPDAVLQAVYETGYGFPSLHAAAAMSLYGFLAFCVWEKRPRWRLAAILFFGAIILAIGFSRMYLGVHWPIDIAGGYLVGFIFVWLGTLATRRLEKFEK
jgi:membrane-associated phospholipid phosphatase